MDPKNVKLNFFQNVKLVLKAIDQEIPWQLILIFVLGIGTALLVCFTSPLLISSSPFLNGLLILFMSIITGIIVAFTTAFILMTIEEKIIPLYEKIKQHYDKEALVMKKEILDNIIEDEVLNED